MIAHTTSISAIPQMQVSVKKMKSPSLNSRRQRMLNWFLISLPNQITNT